jgi:succinate-semialdehyde dehydrogenase / glutarate-semialdehyde dehydrogenase
MYDDVSLLIDGAWGPGAGGQTMAILNPATSAEIGKLACAEESDLERAAQAAARAFHTWSRTSAFERYKVMRKAAELLRQRVDTIAPILTMEEGKPLAQARIEILGAADHIDWCAEEGRRAYGRVVPARATGVLQIVVRQPVGPVAAFTPWNFPVNQAVRKLAGALGAGCSIIIKGPEDTPGSCAELVRCFLDAGIPDGLVNLVYGTPAEISEYLVPHPLIEKISFTGSTAVGKHLASLAGQHMKRATMELGGHSPVIVMDDADLDSAMKQLLAFKFRNAGQVCIAPTRFLVHEKVYNTFVDQFTQGAKAIKVGDGLDESTQMGPLCHSRRVEAMESFIADAVAKGAKIETGGKRIGNKGYFFEPTVLTDVPEDARIMHEEPFGPVAPILPFKDFDSILEEANRLRYGLAAYAYTSSQKTANAIGEAVESGQVSINHIGLALPEVPFGGVKDSGYGSEGGAETLEPYLITKFITQTGL